MGDHDVGPRQRCRDEALECGSYVVDVQTCGASALVCNSLATGCATGDKASARIVISVGVRTGRVLEFVCVLEGITRCPHRAAYCNVTSNQTSRIEGTCDGARLLHPPHPSVIPASCSCEVHEPSSKDLVAACRDGKAEVWTLRDFAANELAFLPITNEIKDLPATRGLTLMR